MNVSGLVASSLNIQNSDFLNGIFHFTAQDYRNLVGGSTDNTVYGVGSGNLTTPGVVSNAGNIQTGNYGSVFLIGPQVGSKCTRGWSGAERPDRSRSGH